MSFEGKIGLVTGAASGMGKIIASRMAKLGMQVVTVDLNLSQLNKEAKKHNNISPYRCDISSREEVDDLVKKIHAELGPVDSLVHAAALMPALPILSSNPDETMKLMKINYGGTVNLVHALLPEMLKKNKGQAVFFGSIAGHVLNTGLGTYSATKSAVNTYIEILQHELKDSKVHIMLVEPNAVDTPLINQALGAEGPKNIKLSKESGRLANPNKIIDAIEEGLRNKTKILLPNLEAKLLMRFRRYFPRILWKIIEKSNS